MGDGLFYSPLDPAYISDRQFGIGRVVSRPLYLVICKGVKRLAFAGKFITWVGESKFCAGWKLRLFSRRDTIFVNNDFPLINKSYASNV